MNQQQLLPTLDGRLWNPGLAAVLVRAVAQSNDVIMITEAEPTDAAGRRIVYVNPAFERMTGYTADEVIGKSGRILQGPRTDRAAIQRIHTALAAWQPIREEVINYRKDGEEFYVELSIAPVEDEAGRCTHWSCIQRDITEQYKLRRELRATNILLRTMTECVPQLLWTADANGEWEWVSDQFAEFVGAEVEDCVGSGWAPYEHPDDGAVAAAKLQACRQQRKVCTAEMRLRNRAGEYKWFLMQAAPRFAADGTVWKWIGSFTDVSDRKAAETALLKSEERLRLGVAAARLGLAEIDYKTGMNHLSAEAAAMFGLGEGAMVVPRERLHAAFHPEDRIALLARLAECIKGVGPDWFEMDHRVILPSGEMRWVRVRNQVTFEQEGDLRRPVRAMLAAFDITDSRPADCDRRQADLRIRGLGSNLQ